MIHTIVLYRPDSTDICRGQVMGTCSADLKLYTHTDLDMIVAYAANDIFKDKKDDKDNVYTGYYVNYFIDGYCISTEWGLSGDATFDWPDERDAELIEAGVVFKNKMDAAQKKLVFDSLSKEEQDRIIKEKEKAAEDALKLEEHKKYILSEFTRLNLKVQ